MKAAPVQVRKTNMGLYIEIEGWHQHHKSSFRCIHPTRKIDETLVISEDTLNEQTVYVGQIPGIK